MLTLKQLFILAFFILSSPLTFGQNDAPILIEEFTATWCGWCPNGSYILDTLLEDRPEVLVVSIHADDPLSFPEGQEVADAFMNGSPSATFNRQKLDGFFKVSVPWNDWVDVVEYDFGGIIPFEVSSSSVYDEDTRELSIEVVSESKGVLNGDFRVNLMVVQKSFTDPGNVSYYQSNFFEGQEGHPLGDAGWPITDYTFKNVLRAMLGGAWGLEGIIPNNTNAGEEYTTTFTYTVPESYDVNNLLLVATVADYDEDVNNRSIITFSAEELDFTSNTNPEDPEDTTTVIVINAIDEILLETNKLTFYPNPVESELYLDTKLAVEKYTIWNATGEKVMEGQRLNEHRINVNKLGKGLYFVEVIDRESVAWRNKFVKR